MNEKAGFSCTSCGRCCHDLNLPLSVSEAINWLDRGGEVGVICDLMPWVDEPTHADKVSFRKKSLSFKATSGQLNVRVTPILVAHYAGACPHLLSDFKCGQYESRPLACRIYPAELNPLQMFDQTSKLCPQEAWESVHVTPLITHEVNDAIESMNALAVLEVNAKANLCRMLNINAAALANQGYVLHQPDRLTCLQSLLELSELMRANLLSEMDSNWCVITHRHESATDLESVGAYFSVVHLDHSSQKVAIPRGTYIGF
jgi:Fe-S-cluster containining protein